MTPEEMEDAEFFPGPVMTRLADVQPCAVEWLWKDRIPMGRVSLLVGMPGAGKTFLTTDATARVTTGSPWPDGSPCPKGSVIIISGEDDLGDTLRPRLDAHHADCNKVYAFSTVRRPDGEGNMHEVMFTLEDVHSLHTALAQHPDCKLVIIDPIGSFLGGGTDSHRDNEVRSVLSPVVKLARDQGAAVLVVAHRRKSSSGNADDLALGSRAFTGLSRAVWHLSKDPEVKGRRLFLPGKCNLAAEPDGLAFSISGEPAAIVWERDPVMMNADDALAAEQPIDKRDGATGASARFLKEILAKGPMPADEVEISAQLEGLSVKSSLRRAKKALGVVSYKESAPPFRWLWKLPGGEDEQAPP